MKLENIETEKYKVKKLGRNEACIGGLLVKVVENKISPTNTFKDAEIGSVLDLWGKLNGVRLILT